MAKTIFDLQKEFDELKNRQEKFAYKIVYKVINKYLIQTKNLAVDFSITAALNSINNISEKDFKQMYFDIYYEIGFAFYEHQKNSLEKLKKIPDLSFFSIIWKQYILLQLNNPKITALITSVTQITKDKLRDILVEAANNRLAPKEISKLFQNKVGFNKSRSLMIARTEMTHAAALGVEYASSQYNLNIKTYKIWIHSKIGNYREEHAAINGKYVEKGKPFNVGGVEMQYPGDSNGGAENVINCRCSYSYISQDGLIELGLK
jgi:hypothetical protein